MKEKEAEFDCYWYYIVFSCWPKQGCKITTCSEIKISEISSTFKPFVKHSAAEVLCKDWRFSWACSQHQLSWKMLRGLLVMGAGKKEAGGRVIIKILFSFFAFSHQNSCSCTAALQMHPCFERSALGEECNILRRQSPGHTQSLLLEEC